MVVFSAQRKTRKKYTHTHNSEKCIEGWSQHTTSEQERKKRTYYTTYGASAHYKLFIPHRYSYDYRQLTVTLRAILRCVSNSCATNAAEAATKNDDYDDHDGQKRNENKKLNNRITMVWWNVNVPRFMRCFFSRIIYRFVAASTVLFEFLCIFFFPFLVLRALCCPFECFVFMHATQRTYTFEYVWTWTAYDTIDALRTTTFMCPSATVHRVHLTI